MKINKVNDRILGSRVAYAYQALIARKFSPALSVQLMPTLVHRNYVATPAEQNDVYALGGALRQKITKRTALTADYYYLFPGNTARSFRNALGLGVDIETGGHVFWSVFLLRRRPPAARGSGRLLGALRQSRSAPAPG